MSLASIYWPAEYVPGFTDNFASNEVIVRGLTAFQAWRFLVTPGLWESYYPNCANVQIHKGEGPSLNFGTRFAFQTFGFDVENEVVEYCAPSVAEPLKVGRLAWHSWCGEGETRLDVHHAWLMQNLEGGRLRILTQETQLGAPARKLAATTPDPMVAGHQEWLRGLVKAALAEA